MTMVDEEETVTTIDLITCSRANLTFQETQMFGDYRRAFPNEEARRESVLNTRMPLQPHEVLVVNRPRDYRVGGPPTRTREFGPLTPGGEARSCAAHPGDITTGAGRWYDYTFDNGRQFNDETCVDYRYHAEILGLTAGIQLICETTGGSNGKVVAIAIASRRSSQDETFETTICEGLCRPLLDRYGYQFTHNFRLASLPEARPLDLLTLLARARELHARRGYGEQVREVTAIARVELYNWDGSAIPRERCLHWIADGTD